MPVGTEGGCDVAGDGVAHRGVPKHRRPGTEYDDTAASLGCMSRTGDKWTTKRMLAVFLRKRWLMAPGKTDDLPHSNKFETEHKSSTDRGRVGDRNNLDRRSSSAFQALEEAAWQTPGGAYGDTSLSRKITNNLI